MRAGLLDTEIKILRPVVVRNAFGEEDQTYEDHYTTRARVIHNSGQRDIENGEILHNYQKTVEVWKYVDVCDTDWVELEGKKYRIQEIEVDKVQQKKVIRLELVND